MKEITSLQNELVKKVIQLQEKARVRKKEKRFVIEGQREIKLALESNYELITLLYCDKIVSEAELENYLRFDDLNPELIRISPLVYHKISHRKTTEGLIAIAKSKELLLNDLTLSENPLILIAQSIEKPGNIGALLRTADAANIDAVILADPVSDLYNPNVIRSSVGCVFTKQIAMDSSLEIKAFLNRNGIKAHSAVLHQNSQPYPNYDFSGPTAIVVGTESTGLTESWLDDSIDKVIIPMQGKIDSLNVSVSAAILIFEAKRQRDFG